MKKDTVQYTGHGANTGGLQGHSVGADYPLCVVGISLEGHHEEKAKWQAQHLTKGWCGPIREAYSHAQSDLVLRRLQGTIRDACRNSHAYTLGFILYTTGSKSGNPFNPHTEEYGLFGKGFYDARRLQSMQECADSGYTNVGLKMS